MKTILALVITLLCVTPAFAQISSQDLAARYDTATIRQLSAGKFSLNNKKLKKKELKRLLASYTESAEALKAFKKQQRIATTLWIVSGVSYVTGLVLISENDDLALGLITGALATTFATVPFSMSAQKNLAHAVWLYNRSVLTGANRITAGAH